MGASGNIGTELAARAAPDGYTIPMGNVAPNAINVSLFKNLAPAHTPRAVIARLHVEIVKILADPTLRARLADQGFEPVGNSPEEFRAYIKSEITKWGKNNPRRGHPAGMTLRRCARAKRDAAQKAILTPARTPLPPIFTSLPLCPVVAARCLYCKSTPT